MTQFTHAISQFLPKFITMYVKLMNQFNFKFVFLYTHTRAFYLQNQTKADNQVLCVWYKISPFYRKVAFKMKNILSHEVCLIGGGPVGLTLANCLAKSPCINSIAVIDRKLPTISIKPSTIPNQRVYSINGLSLDIFNSIGIRNKIRKSNVMSRINVVSKQSQSFVQWNQNQALMVQNDQIVNALYTNIKQDQFLSNKVEFIESEIVNYEVQSECQNCKIELKNGKMLKTELLVGSDGNKSKVKELAQIPTYGWNYNQRAIVCTLKLADECFKLDSGSRPNDTGFQIFYQGNVLALLPLWQNYASIVWSLSLADFQHIMGKSDNDFLSTLNTLIGNSNRTFQGEKTYIQIPFLKSVLNKRLSFPLSTLQAGNYTKQRIALIGDSAHSIHPMAGLGVNSGIIDSALLANNIILNKKTGNDIGQAMALSSFESKSKAFNYANSLAMESIKKSFQVDNTFVNFGRKLGMNLFESSSFIKDQMKSAVNSNPLAEIRPFQWEEREEKVY